MTDEDLSIVDPWIQRAQPGYPIVALEGDAFESAFKVDGFPCQAVIDTEGKISYSDGFGRTGANSPLSAAMKKAAKGSIWPKKFDKVASFIGADQLDKGYAELTKALAGAAEFTPAETAAADKLKAFLEGAAVDAVAEARAAFDDGRIYDAHQRVRSFALAKPPFPATPDGATLLAEMEALPDFKDEMKAGEQFIAAKALERKGEYSDAFKAYRAIVKALADTKMAAVARAAAESLNERGLPGYDRNCNACDTGRQACEKHAEKLKL